MYVMKRNGRSFYDELLVFWLLVKMLWIIIVLFFLSLMVFIWLVIFFSFDRLGFLGMVVGVCL